MSPGLSAGRMRQIRIMAEAVSAAPPRGTDRASEEGVFARSRPSHPLTRAALAPPAPPRPSPPRAGRDGHVGRGGRLRQAHARLLYGQAEGQGASSPSPSSSAAAVLAAREGPPLTPSPSLRAPRPAQVSETLAGACARLDLPKPVLERARQHFAAFRDARQNVTALGETTAACLVAAFEE